MIDNLGGNTEDLITLRHPLPTENNTQPGDREHRLRRFGRINYVTGITVGVLLGLNSLGTALITEHHAFDNPDAQLFAVLALVGFIVTAGALVVVGGLERLQRPQRSATRHMVAQLAVMQDQLNHLVAVTAVVPGRLARIDDRLDPVEQAIGSLAVHLPDALQREHWMGFNDAIREGFTEQTGTEGGKARRGRHLGIAPVESTDD